jgi:multidrug efflux pump
MTLSGIFITRPVATTLLTLGVVLVGTVAFFLLPVSPLPQVDFPVILVSASMPGASPETMATSVATPLERHLGQIADVNEMTSSSSLGQTRIILQFGISRDIDGAARDVQAAINAARVDLPASLRSNPTYRKVNPADFPIFILTLTSGTLTPGQMYDSAATVLQQKLSQVEGVGQVTISGSSLPAVRIELNPRSLSKYGIGLEDVRAALASANANSPKGAIENHGQHFQIYTNDQARHAAEYHDLVIAYRNGAAVRLADLAEVSDSVEDLRNLGLANGKPAVLLILSRQPGANIIATVDRLKALLPSMRASIPADIDLVEAVDLTTTIRTSLRDVERTLLISTALVILVVFIFLRDGPATLIPSVVVPVSLIGTFGAMYLLGFSLNNLSLMALIIATGFVVDDAIVVLENTSRHVDAGMPPLRAAMVGAREVMFTVLSMSLSLIAVFAPILLMSGLMGRMFREFAVTLSVAIVISLALSLTTTAMMCSRLLRNRSAEQRSAFYRLGERGFNALREMYAATLTIALAHRRLTMLSLAGAIGLNVYLFAIVPKGLIPQQDTGRMAGSMQADQNISFQLMSKKLIAFLAVVKDDPAVAGVVGFTGGSATNSGFVFASLKPQSERTVTSDQVIERLRDKLMMPGAQLYFQAGQDLRMGGRQGNAQYQYTLQADELSELYAWTPRITKALGLVPELSDVNSDQQEQGLETDLVIDRASASRLGLSASVIDNTLYDAFGQRQVSTIYNALNQYHVVMEVAPQYWQDPETLNDLFISTSGGAVSGTQQTNAAAGTVVDAKIPGGTFSHASIANDAARNARLNALANTTHSSTSTGAAISTASETMIPLSSFSHFGPGTMPLAVNHQGHFAAATITFNQPPGYSLSDAEAAITSTMAKIGVPDSIHGSFQGTAKTYQDSKGSNLLLIIAALLAVYIVLGILYESFIHPITILSTLPSAGIGALLALLGAGAQLDIIGMIGMLLLIGIVKKNAIMMIDVAIDAERHQGMTAAEAIHYACLLRFRPIMMTTMVALLSAVPLALGRGEGAELRHPLGISIVGGLVVSQMLTLYTTPVVYLYLDRLSTWLRPRGAGGLKRSRQLAQAPSAIAAGTPRAGI